MKANSDRRITCSCGHPAKVLLENSDGISQYPWCGMDRRSVGAYAGGTDFSVYMGSRFPCLDGFDQYQELIPLSWPQLL